MTTGTRTKDLRTSVSTSCGAALAGSYYSKTWSGTDYPATVPTFSEVTRYVFVRTKQPRLKGLALTARLPDTYKLVKKLKKNKPPRRSLVVDHPYTCSWQSYFDPSMKWGFSPTSQNLTGTIHSCFGGVSIPGSTWGSNDDIALLGKLREAVAGSSFNAGVFLGEGRQACDMIGDAAIRIAKAWKFARRGRFDRAAIALTDNGKLRPMKKVTANNWLELQYGWLPLLQDAHDGAQFLAHQMSVPLEHRVRVRHRRLLTPKIGACTCSVARGAIAGQIIAKLREKDVITLSGLTDPASVLWEVMPYSFVIDWFIPVGNYLAARGLAQSLTGSFVKTVTLRYKLASVTSFGSGYYGSSPSYHQEGGSVTRTVSTTLAVPLPESKGLEKAASWRHCANALALLTQLVK